MDYQIILASNSEIRKQLLINSGLMIKVRGANIDESSIKNSLIYNGCNPRDIADALAEAKSKKLSQKETGSLVLGCDQILDFNENIISKAKCQEDLIDILLVLSGKTHKLHSAAVIYKDGEPLWRHIDTAKLTMSKLSERHIENYVSKNWEDIKHCVGGYKIEGFGIRLFDKIEGDYFTILGLPLVQILTYLTSRGDISL